MDHILKIHLKFCLLMIFNPKSMPVKKPWFRHDFTQHLIRGFYFGMFHHPAF